MKKITAIATILAACLTASAQTTITTATNATPMPSFSAGLQQVYDAATVSTNYGLAFGAARATTGNRNVAFADYVYNVSANVGLVLGYDYLWTAKSAGIPSQANLVKGGVSFSAVIYPLKNFGLTNFTMTPYASGLVATGNGSASEIIVAGDKFNLVTFSGWNLSLGVLYETRKDAGYWDADYVGGLLALSKGF